jgi:hypothetical protein
MPHESSSLRACETCGQQFFPAHRNHRFCSRACKPRQEAGRPAACDNCGQEFTATQEHRNYRRKYCGMKCAGEAQAARRVAKYPPREEVVRLYEREGLSDKDLGRHFGHSHQWALSVRKYYGIPGRPKGDSKVSRRPLGKKRDRARWSIDLKREPDCRNCNEPSQILHLHHAVPRSQSLSGKYDLRNGVPLCPSCHLGWHNKQVNIYRDIFTAPEWEFISSLTGSPWLDANYPERPEGGGSLAVEYCQRGHRRTPDNTNGRGGCRTCANLRAAKYRAAA